MDFSFSSGNALSPTPNQASQTLAHTYNPNQQTARLFLFSPRSIVDTCKRPQMYQFTYPFLEDMLENINNIWHGNGDLQNKAFMDNKQSALSAIVPHAQGTIMNNKYFNDCWTFILQIDNEQFDNHGLITGHKLANRFVYSGFVAGEPVSSLNGINVTINPTAILKITHSTGLSKSKRFSINNDDQTKTIVDSDTDYIPGDIAKMINPDVTAFLHPQVVAKSMTSVGTDQLITDSSSQLAAMPSGQVIPMNTLFNSPKHHLHTIMGSVMATLDQASADTISGGAIHSIQGVPASVDTVKMDFINNIPGMPGTNMISLDGSKSYSLKELLSRYPYLEIIPITSEKLTRSDLADQSIVSRSNVASSIVVGAVPMIMANSGLCELAFSYTTFKPNTIFNNNNMFDDNHAYVILNVAPWVQEETQMTKMRVKAFITNFKQQVVPMILEIGGDFDVSISCNAAGECDCLLKFLEDGSVGTDGIYESPLLLGGLNSSMIGGDDILHNNVSNMATLQQAMISEIDHIVPGFNSNNLFQMPLTNPLDRTSTIDENAVNNVFGNLPF